MPLNSWIEGRYMARATVFFYWLAMMQQLLDIRSAKESFFFLLAGTSLGLGVGFIHQFSI